MSRTAGISVPARVREDDNGQRTYTLEFDSDESITNYPSRLNRSTLLGRRTSRTTKKDHTSDTEKFCTMYKEGFFAGSNSAGSDRALVLETDKRRLAGKVTDKWFVEGFCDGFNFSQSYAGVNIPSPDVLALKNYGEDEPRRRYIRSPSDKTMRLLAREVTKLLKLYP